MKWKSHRHDCYGRIAYRRVFALLPTLCDDGKTVWLQNYWDVFVWIGDIYDGRPDGSYRRGGVLRSFLWERTYRSSSDEGVHAAITRIGSYFAGMLIDEMTREQLLGVIAILHRQHESQRDEHTRHLTTLVEFR